MSETDFPEQTPEQALLIQRVQRMMQIAGATTALAIAALLIAIGYRLFTSEGSSATNDVTATLPGLRWLAVALTRRSVRASMARLAAFCATSP